MHTAPKETYVFTKRPINSLLHVHTSKHSALPLFTRAARIYSALLGAQHKDSRDAAAKALLCTPPTHPPANFA